MPSRSEGPLRVVLADDHAPMRQGVREVLEEDGFMVVAEVGDADAAIEAAVRERPDVCVLDVRMPGDGIAAARAISGAVPDVHIVMLSVSTDDRDVFAALRAGASGYLPKDMDPRRLPAAIRGVARGEAALPRALTAHLIEEYRGRGDRRKLPRLGGEPLSDRERDVLELLTDGLASAEIALQLRISPVTVRRHVSEVVRKLDAADRQDAVRMVREARGDAY